MAAMIGGALFKAHIFFLNSLCESVVDGSSMCQRYYVSATFIFIFLNHCHRAEWIDSLHTKDNNLVQYGDIMYMYMYM